MVCKQEVIADGAGQYMESVLQPILVQGLTVLAKEKPCAQPVEALSFLGQWLLDNNPNKVSSVTMQGYCMRLELHALMCFCNKM